MSRENAVNKEQANAVRHEIAQATHKFAGKALGEDYSKLDILVIRNAMNIGAMIARRHADDPEGLEAIMREDCLIKDIP
jgi:hypothetical protein